MIVPTAPDPAVAITTVANAATAAPTIARDTMYFLPHVDAHKLPPEGDSL